MQLAWPTPPIDLKKWISQFSHHRKYWGLQTEVQKTVHWKAVERARSGWYIAAASIIKRRFEEERQLVLREIRTSFIPQYIHFAVEDILDRGLPEWEKLLTALYLVVGEAFAQRTLDGIAKGILLNQTKAMIDIWKDQVLGWLATESSKKVKQINQTTRTDIRIALAEGVSAGEGIDKIADRVDQLYLKKIIPYRSEVIARTEVISASNLGSRAGAKQTGLPLNKEWIATRDGRTRDDHAAADGEIKDLDAPYSVGGEKLMFPGDTSLGASAGMVIQCRCTEAYIRKDIPVSPRIPQPWQPVILDKYPSKKDAIKTEEAAIWDRPIENAVVIDQDGTIRLRKSGTEGTVSFTDEELMLLKEKTVTHNHPEFSDGKPGGSFSMQDILFAKNHNLQEIRAVDQYTRYSMKPPAVREGWDAVSVVQLRRTYRRNLQEVLQKYDEEYRLGLIDRKQHRLKVLNETWRRTSDELGIQYSISPWRKDWGRRGKAFNT